jgi:hypothetical protein
VEPIPGGTYSGRDGEAGCPVQAFVRRISLFLMMTKKLRYPSLGKTGARRKSKESPVIVSEMPKHNVGLDCYYKEKPEAGTKSKAYDAVEGKNETRVEWVNRKVF